MVGGDVDKEMESISNKFIAGIKNTNFMEMVKQIENVKSEDEVNTVISIFKTKHEII